jgi:cobalt-zinc-cadmium efflux system protein
MSAAHSHAGLGRTAADRYLQPLAWALGLSGGFLVIEVGGALWSGSLALLADAGHLLTDVGGLSLSLLAVWFARKPPTLANTYGYFRLEILAALANGVVLFLVAGYVLYEACTRLWAPPEILWGPMLVIAVLGLGANLLGMWLLHGGAEESLNLRGAYMEVLGDALASVGVILAAVTIRLTGVYLVDPIISGIIGLCLLPRTWRLIRQAVHILMEGVPPHLDVREIEMAMLGVSGVRAVHDLHVWTLTSGKDAMSAHVLVVDRVDREQALWDLQRLLRERFAIEHTTFQFERSASALLQLSLPPEERSGDAPSGRREQSRNGESPEDEHR